jgi:hypothetical protein
MSTGNVQLNAYTSTMHFGQEWSAPSNLRKNDAFYYATRYRDDKAAVEFTRNTFGFIGMPIIIQRKMSRYEDMG